MSVYDPPEPTEAEIEEWERQQNRHRFALRTIKDGRVTIHGNTYAPDPKWLPYDGRLDGMRYAFGLYRHHPEFVCLWGTEAAYVSDDPGADWPGPECVDGMFVWTWWRQVRP